MEPAAAATPIDIRADPELARLLVGVIADGGCAWVRLREGADPVEVGERCVAVDGIAGWAPGGRRRLVLMAEPGRSMLGGSGGGVHGGPRTARTLAIVGGGHPAAGAIALAIEERPPRLVDWAPTIARVLGLRLPRATGVSLLRTPG